MSSPDIAEILDNTELLDQLRKELKQVLLEINKLHKKLQATPKIDDKLLDTSLSKLKILYIQATELSQNEETVCTFLLTQLDSLFPDEQQGRKLEGNDQKRKRKRMKLDSDVMRISPSMRDLIEAYANLKGEQVAARVTAENADKDEWFVVRLIHFDRETKEVEVLDEEPGDDDEEGSQRTYVLPMSCIIPFPKRNDTWNSQVFPRGRHVLAVYPGTTTLYKATVISPPRKRKSDEYLLEFDDDEEDGVMPQRTVPFHEVVALPEDHRQ